MPLNVVSANRSICYLEKAYPFGEVHLVFLNVRGRTQTQPPIVL